MERRLLADHDDAYVLFDSRRQFNEAWPSVGGMPRLDVSLKLCISRIVSCDNDELKGLASVVFVWSSAVTKANGLIPVAADLRCRFARFILWMVSSIDIDDGPNIFFEI